MVEHIDALDYTSKFFRKIYNDAYLALVRRAPGVIGWLYQRLDRPWQHPSRRLALDRLNTGPMIRLLEQLQPDLCLSTHFLPAEIISWLKAKRKFRARHAVVITDFDIHALWLCQNVDRYYVATEEAAEYLKRIGVPADALRVAGIPVDPSFAEVKMPEKIREPLGLDPNRMTLLVAGGGYAVGPLERLVADLLALDRPWQIVAVAGRATAIRSRLEGLATRAAKIGSWPRLHVLGFTTEMDRWMAAADLLIGKAGGLTVSEALACGLPMAIVGVLPGPQEDRNADFLLEQGAAIRCHNLPTAAWKIARLLDDAARLASMRSAALHLGRPRAASEIVRDSIHLLAAGAADPAARQTGD